MIALICISLMIRYVEHLCIYLLVICRSSLEMSVEVPSPFYFILFLALSKILFYSLMEKSY